MQSSMVLAFISMGSTDSNHFEIGNYLLQKNFLNQREKKNCLKK